MAPPTPKYIRELDQVKGVGRKTRIQLQRAFPSEEELHNASDDALCAVIRYKDTAARVRRFLDGDASEVVLGKKHVTVWNTQTRKMVRGFFAPTEDGLAAFLEASPHFEVYKRQDRAVKSLTHVPQRAVMLASDFRTLGFDGLDEADAERSVRVRAFEHGLVPRPLESATGLLEALCRATSGRLEDLRRVAAGGLSVPPARLDARLAELPPQQAWADILDAVHAAQLAPIWVFVPVADARYLHVVGGSCDGVGLPPVYLSQVGAGRFLPLSLLRPEPGRGADEAAAAGAAGAVDGGGGAPASEPAAEDVPQLKVELKAKLRALEQLIGEIGHDQRGAAHVEQVLAEVRELSARTESAAGLDAVLLGMNGIGKSTLANALLFCSSEDEDWYKGQQTDKQYTLEALVAHAPPDVELPSLCALLRDEGRLAALLKDAAVDVRVLEPPEGPPARAAELHASRMAQLAAHCRGLPRAQANPFQRFLLPCGNVSDTTTSVGIALRYGRRVHLSIAFRSLEELQAMAFEFVQLRRHGAIDIDADPEGEGRLKLAYATYKMVTAGEPVDKDQLELDEASDGGLLDAGLPSDSKDVQVCARLVERVRNEYAVFVGRGASLHADRLAAHEQLARLMSKQSVDALAVRSISLYHPSAMLEGGNGLVDLPGLNASGVIEQVQTRDGVQASSTGAVVVVLNKSIDAADIVTAKLAEYRVLRLALSRDEASRKRLIFVFNCEEQSRELLVANLPETARVSKLAEDTRKKLKRLLTIEAKRLNAETGEPAVTEEEIGAIVAGTLMLPVYPMLHVSAMINRSAHPEEAAAADRHSGVLRLLGSIEELNHTALLSGMARLCAHTLPQLSQTLKSTLDDATCDLPQALVELAHKMVGGKRSNEAYGLALDDVKHRVTEEFEGQKKKLRDVVHGFFCTDRATYEPLHAGRAEQRKRWAELDRNCTSYHRALSAVSPVHNGMCRKLELMPVAFPRAVGGAYDALCDRVLDMLGELKTTVIELVVEAVVKLHQSKGAGSSSASEQQLWQTVSQYKIDAPLADRVACFFSAKQQALDLQQNQPAKHIAKLVHKERLSALKASVLSRSSRCMSLPEIRELVDQNCLLPQYQPLEPQAAAEGEEREPDWEAYDFPPEFKLTRVETDWLAASTTKVSKLVDAQLLRFRNELIGHGQRGKGLLHDMLASFFSHVVQTASIAGDAPTRSALLEQVRELDGRIGALAQLHAHGVTLRNDAEQLGSAMARRFADSLLWEQIRRDAGALTLPEIDQRMRTAPSHTASEHWSMQVHAFACGQLGDLVALVESLRNNYGLDAARGPDGRPVQLASIFECLARVLWTRETIDEFGARAPGRPSGGDGAFGRDESMLALQLRALAVAQMTYHYVRRGGNAAQLRSLLGAEPVEGYLARLRAGDAPGDALCLWHLADHLMQKREILFRVWLPGVSALPVMVPQPRVRTAIEQSCAFDLIIGGCAQAAGSAQRAVEPRAAAYEPLFTPVVRRPRATGSASFSADPVERVREFSPDNARFVPNAWAAAAMRRSAEASAAKRARQH